MNVVDLNEHRRRKAGEQQPADSLLGVALVSLARRVGTAMRVHHARLRAETVASEYIARALQGLRPLEAESPDLVSDLGRWFGAALACTRADDEWEERSHRIVAASLLAQVVEARELTVNVDLLPIAEAIETAMGFMPSPGSIMAALRRSGADVTDCGDGTVAVTLRIPALRADTAPAGGG